MDPLALIASALKDLANSNEKNTQQTTRALEKLDDSVKELQTLIKKQHTEQFEEQENSKYENQLNTGKGDYIVKQAGKYCLSLTFFEIFPKIVQK